MRVYGNKVAVKLDLAKVVNETSSGLIVVNTVKAYERKGVVIGVGPGHFLTNGSRSGIDVKLGATVYLKERGLVKFANLFQIDDEWIAFVYPHEILTEVTA